MTRSAAIVGAGVGGLATAVGLTRNAWEVTVFERWDRTAGTGTGFGMWPPALRALDDLGVGETLRKEAQPQQDGVFRRPDGSVIATLDVDRLRRRAGEGVYLVSRPALLELLLAELPAGVVRFGEPVTRLDDLTTSYDVVVGADGLWSTTRAELLGDRHVPRYAGATVWRGVAPMDVDRGGETWGPGAKFGITPLEPGRTNWYAVVAVPEQWRPTGGAEAELRQRFGGWHEPIPAVLDRFADSEVLHHDLYHLAPPLRSYVHDNVALVGDAAHGMTPDLGQGACQALVDGVVLAQCLSGSDVPTGLATYDGQRRRPTQRLARVSSLAGRLAQVRRWKALRDLTLKAALLAGPPA